MKKSVALSGVHAGNTTICTVGEKGNDLFYRGYKIEDLTKSCCFEEVFFLLIKGKLPTEDFLFNQFQSTVFSKHLYYLPLFEEITLKFGIKPLLSGSGSCCFCLGKSGIRMEEVEEVIRKAWGEDCCLIRTRFRGKEKHSILFS